MTYKEPQGTAFARSPILYAVYDSLFIGTDFQYTCDVYIWQGSGGGTKPSSPQYSLSKYPEPNGAARFNVQSLVRDFLIDKKYTFSNENDTYLLYSFLAVTLNYTYTSGGSTITGTPIVLTEVLVLDGYNKYLEGVNFLTTTNLGINAFSSYANRIATDDGILEAISCVPSTLLGLTGKGYWMTDRPLTMNMPTGTSMYQFIYKDSTALVYKVILNINNGGVVIEYITSGYTNEIAAIKVGSTEIQALADSQNYTTAITGWTVAGYSQEGTRLTQEYTFSLVDPCKWGFKNLRFLNRYGVWDNIIVYGSRIETLNVERTEIMSSPLDVTTAPDWDFTEEYGQLQMRNVHGRESLTVNTGWIPETWNDTIKQMMLTQHLYDPDTLQPYTIETNSLTMQTDLNNGLINYTFKLKQANTAINTVY